MKKLVLLASVMGLVAPAQAARVTNLDHVPHVVTFEHAGSIQEQTVQPDRTARFPRLDGMIGLKGGNPGKSRVNADGMLRGTIGDGRTTRIPAGPADDFAIWPGGKMYLQRRIKGLNGSN